MLKRKCENISFEVEVGKIKTKTYFVPFSKTRSLKALLLLYRNSIKKLKKSWLSSGIRVWTLLLCESLKIGQKTMNETTKKDQKSMQNNDMGKKHIVCKILSLYTINNLFVV